jgi:hypothetical protein
MSSAVLVMPPRSLAADFRVLRTEQNSEVPAHQRWTSSVAGEILDAVLADALPLVVAVKASYNARAAASPRSGTVGPDACL